MTEQGEEQMSEKATEPSEEFITARRRLFYVNQRIRDLREELTRFTEERKQLKERIDAEAPSDGS
jgi:hypothetical protein